MSNTSPWNKAKVPTTGRPDNSYPEIQSGATRNTQKTQYEEIQEDELIALASIYGEDFQNIQTKSGAWKVRQSII